MKKVNLGVSGLEVPNIAVGFWRLNRNTDVKTAEDFIKTAMHARLEEGQTLPLLKFIRALDKACEELKMREDLPHRYVNEGFSGGEKKRNEILQMKLLKPSFALLDEIDSGLDVDALRVVSKAINSMRSDSFGCMMVSHYQRLFELVPPSHVHVLVNGKIVLSGGVELIEKIDNEGYEWVREYGVELEKEEEKQRIVLGTCAANPRSHG